MQLHYYHIHIEGFFVFLRYTIFVTNETKTVIINHTICLCLFSTAKDDTEDWHKRRIVE
jgi:hypothetical protein